MRGAVNDGNYGELSSSEDMLISSGFIGSNRMTGAMGAVEKQVCAITLSEVEGSG